MSKDLPHIKWDWSRRDFNYIKRLVLDAPKTHAQRRVLKSLWEAQDYYFKARSREQRLRMVEYREQRGEDGWTLQDGIEILHNAHYYIMRTSKAFWYDKTAQETSKILAKHTSDLRKELKESEDTGDRNRVGEHLPCDGGGQVVDEGPTG